MEEIPTDKQHQTSYNVTPHLSLDLSYQTNDFFLASIQNSPNFQADGDVTDDIISIFKENSPKSHKAYYKTIRTGVGHPIQNRSRLLVPK